VEPSNFDRYAPGAELVLRIQLGAFFAWSGWMKAFHTGFDDFTRAVGNYQLAKPPWDAAIAYTVPWVEMIVGVCLVLGIWKRGALIVLAGLVACFAFGVVSADLGGDPAAVLARPKRAGPRLRRDQDAAAGMIEVPAHAG
jgi:uncharacterized membrane protein YphA (DoxX/SURF4 family)